MSLANEMQRVGRLLAYDRNLRVDVRGTRAFSVPGRIVIPNAETFAHLGIRTERMLHAILDHECGHARWTDHQVMATARERGGEPLASIVNSLEDGRIEKLMGAEFKGCAQNLHIKNRWFWEDPEWQKGFLAADGWTAFTIAFCVVVRHSVTIDEVRALRPDIADLLKACAGYLARADRLASSAEALALGTEMWEDLCEPPPPPPPSPSQGEEQDEQEQQQSDDEEDDEDSQDEKPSSGSPEASEDDGDEEDEEQPGTPLPGAGEPQEDDDEEGEDGEGDGEDGAGAGPEGEDDEDTDGDDGGNEGPHDNEGDGEGKPEQQPAEAGDEAGDEDDTAPGEQSDEGDDGDETDGEKQDGGIIDPYRAIRGQNVRHGKPKGVVNPEEAVSKLMEREFEHGQQYRVFSHEFDVERDFVRDPPEAGRFEYDDTIEEIEADAVAASSTIAQAFEVALRARREKRPVSGADEGEIDLDVFSEFAVGAASSDTIYKQFVAEDDRDVTVAIMLDCSGSMAAGRDHLAKRVAYALSLALKSCSIDHEITGFTTLLSASRFMEMPWALDWQGRLHTHFANMRAAMVEAQQHGVSPTLFARELYDRGFGRGSTVDVAGATLQVPFHAIFKPYGVSDLRGLIYAQGSCNNLDGEAVLWQARRLALRPEKRRVMFVLSDGMPAGARDSRLGAEHLKESVQRVIAAGIEVYGIGMESEAVRHFYPRYWIAKSMENLMEVAFNGFVETLTAGREESACVQL